MDPERQVLDQVKVSPPHSLAVTTWVAVVCTLLVLSPVAYTAYRHLPAQVVTVDLQKLIEDDQQRTIAMLGQTPDGVATDAQRQVILQNTRQFADRLGTALDVVGQHCRCVVVNKAAVLSGTAPDYTAVIGQQLSSKP